MLFADLYRVQTLSCTVVELYNPNRYFFIKRTGLFSYLLVKPLQFAIILTFGRLIKDLTFLLEMPLPHI